MLNRNIITLLILSFALSMQGLKAEETGGLQLDKWILTQKEAFDKAKEQGKLIFLLGGRETCPNCQSVVKTINEDVTLNTIVNESYVLWYISWDNVKNNPKAEGYTYVKDILDEGKIKTLPALFIIDPENPDTSMFMASGFHNAAKLKELMDFEGRPVSENTGGVANERVQVEPVKAYIAGNALTISNNIAGETIRVYTIMGNQVGSFIKSGTHDVVDASRFPKGVLIVSSSAGWVKKVIRN